MNLRQRIAHRILGHEWVFVRDGLIGQRTYVERYECICGHYGLARGLGRITDMGR